MLAQERLAQHALGELVEVHGDPESLGRSEFGLGGDREVKHLRILARSARAGSRGNGVKRQ